MNGDIGKSRNFDEITLAITILTGLSFVLFKIVDYFNNNTIGLSDDMQMWVRIFVSGLLIELAIIFQFIILKGYLLFAGSKKERLKFIADTMFKSFIAYFVFLSLVSIFLLSLIIASSPEFVEKPYYVFISYAFIILPVYATLRIIFYLFDLRKDDFIKSVNIQSVKHSLEILGKSINMQSVKRFLEILGKSGFQISDVCIVSIIVITVISISLIAPIYLLGGSYSIDVFPQSEVKSSILTFSIKETGITSGKNFVNLYKLDDKTGFQDIDNITINYTHETQSKNKMMLGKKHEGIWYLNLNTSSLSYGNYMLHAEVSYTNLINLGVFKKHADKLFYIQPNNINYLFNST